MNDTIFIIAGEPSADMHGSHLVKELKALSPNLKISGIGSKQMSQAGVKIFADLTKHAVIGFIEVLKHLKIYKQIFEMTIRKVKETKPKAIILIDFPGFNLRLAKRIKKECPQVKIIYYISPQIWAWGKKRVHLIRDIVDHMIVIFEFEKKLYERNNVPVTFVGHPLTDTVKNTQSKSLLLKKLSYTEKDLIIGLLPGSREVEIKRILPVMLKSAQLFAQKMPQTKFILIKSPNIKDELINELLHKYPVENIQVIKENNYNFLSVCFFAWVCSGTATLETAILGIPMAIVYKTSLFTWCISKFLIKLPFIGLINVVAEEKIVEEFIQFQATPKNITECSLRFFQQNRKSRDQLILQLTAAKLKLGSSGANKNAARTIASLIQ
ncbi:MAG: lipid-A-disaccharide synthase [PVC group bacterium]|nr:lipid-A-disaccharide synthase [PVC group bacterium]